MHTSRTILSALLLIFFTAGCLPASGQTTEDGLQTASPTTMIDSLPDAVTSTPLPTPTPAPTATEISPTPTTTPAVRVTAINGNLYIRRGPGTAYNRIGLLSKDTEAIVIGKDMLSKWVQVNIPNAEYTGWVSLLTPYSKVDGDLSQVPAFTFKEWPEPAYIKNCTEHNLLVTPNELFLYPLWTNSSYLNEVQVDPGVYEIHDLFVPGEPMIEQVDVQEGETVYITVNGLGVKHNCP
jgi:hypothetical protein